MFGIASVEDCLLFKPLSREFRCELSSCDCEADLSGPFCCSDDQRTGNASSVVVVGMHLMIVILTGLISDCYFNWLNIAGMQQKMHFKATSPPRTCLVQHVQETEIKIVNQGLCLKCSLDLSFISNLRFMSKDF